MRSRSNSGVRLDYYQRIVHRLIMSHQQPVTGLFPASPANHHAWVNNILLLLLLISLSLSLLSFFIRLSDLDI